MSFPIVFSTDNNYLAPTYVAITSLLHHLNKETQIEIYILCSNIKDSQKQYFHNLNANISFIDVELKDLYLNNELDYISIATYYRFLIPQKLTQYDKCLYLDSDIIIKEDITPLIQEPIEDYLLMGSRNYFSKECNPEFYKQRCADCSIKSLDKYINAGVLLINLKKFREKHLYEIMMKDVQNNKYPYNDQDILNKYCSGEIGLFSVKYNFLVQYLKRTEAVSKALNEDICENAKNPVIIHYSTRKKPWKYKGYLMSNYWMDELKYIQNEQSLKELIYPFICAQRNSRTIKELIIDDLKFIYRKYIKKNFYSTTQKIP